LKQKNREATTPRFSFVRCTIAQSDLLEATGFALEAGFVAFSLEAEALLSDVDATGSDVDAPFSAAFGVSLDEALPLVPLAALEVSAGGGLFLA
jgi:hypothetical protein